MNSLIINAEKKIKKDWKKYLKEKGVKFPTGNKLIELICLYLNMPNPMTQDEIEKWHQKNKREYKRQARHLADAGWYIKSGNTRFTRGVYEKKFSRSQMSLHLISEPNPIWNRNSEKRLNNLSETEWKNILEKFKDRGCAVCGRKIHHYDKGHLLKSKSEEKGNIVPMCSECNNWGLEVEFKMYGLIARPIMKKK